MINPIQYGNHKTNHGRILHLYQNLSIGIEFKVLLNLLVQFHFYRNNGVDYGYPERKKFINLFPNKENRWKKIIGFDNGWKFIDSIIRSFSPPIIPIPVILYESSYWASLLGFERISELARENREIPSRRRPAYFSHQDRMNFSSSFVLARTYNTFEK